MATCKDCLHLEACVYLLRVIGFDVSKDQNREGADKRCSAFTDKSRFVELPCEAGDVVYFPLPDGDCETYIDVGAVFAIGIDALHTMWISARYESGLKYYHTSEDLGKTVFLTREEAEAALAERRKNGITN